MSTPAIKEPHMRIARLPGNPIIRPHMDARMGTNINGPSLIRVPPWLADPLGTYYLYEPGTLQLAQSHFLTTPPEVPPELQPHLEEMARQRTGLVGVESPLENATAVHIASPDVHVIDEHREIRSRPGSLPPSGVTGGDVQGRHPFSGGPRDSGALLLAPVSLSGLVLWHGHAGHFLPL
jgi:hypothetical protein